MIRRQEFLETEYINGLYDDKGNELIRPMNDDEKAWLDKYYKETLSATFLYEDSFFPIEGIDHLSNSELKEIKKEFLTEDIYKTVDREQLENESKVDEVAKKYKIKPETLINLMKRKEVYDANNHLNACYFKNTLRTTCESKCETNEDYYYLIDDYYPNHDTNVFEELMITCMDYEHRVEMGWDKLEE